MKRYDFDIHADYSESVDGGWIRYSDHVEAMKRIASDDKPTIPLPDKVMAELSDVAKSRTSRENVVDVLHALVSAELRAAPPQAAPVAQTIHYPECWDTAVFPTLESALREIGAFRCTNDDCASLAAPVAQGLPPMPSNVAHVTRRIRRCESDAPAQLVLEHFAMEYARAAVANAAPALLAASPADQESRHE